jgi:membrane-bound serine protease (ClpP class)
MLVVHNEPKNAPTRAAAKAMKGLPARADHERWRFLLVEWAERLEICSGAFERKIGTDYFDDIIRSSNLLDRFRRDRSHARLIIFASFDFRSDAKLTQQSGVSQKRPAIFCRVKTKLLILTLLCALGTTTAHAREVIGKGDIVVVPLRGEVAPSLLAFVRRAVKTAEANEASAIIFDMNTYGGRLDAAADIVNALNQTKIPTYTFINTNAGSAGALIAIATRHIYMAPVSAIGAAAPVLSTGEDLPTTAKEKTVSYWSALIRGSATKNGHNPDVAEAFMNKDKEVKIGDRVIHPRGAILTLNAQEATERINGKPLLAEGLADSIADLTKKAGLKGNVVTIEPTGFEQIALWITALAPLLLLLGILGAYIEFKTAGVGWAGIISAICFALFFLGHYLAGLAGWEVVALFVLGIVLVLLEVIFFAHSTIVFGVVGVFLMLASLLWAMIDRYPGQNFFPTGTMLAVPLLNMFIAIVGSVVVIALLARYLPRTSIYRRFALMESNPPGPSLTGAPRHFATALALTPGMHGTTVTVLRPSGKARFADHIVDVVTEGEFIAPQTPVTVIQTDGMRVVVKSSQPA